MQTEKQTLSNPILVVIAAFDDKGEFLYSVTSEMIRQLDPQENISWAAFHGHIRDAFWISSSDMDEMNRLAKAWYSNMKVVPAQKHQNRNSD